MLKIVSPRSDVMSKLVITSSKAIRVGTMVIVMYLSIVDVRNRVRGNKYEDTTSGSDSGMDAEATYFVRGTRPIVPYIFGVGFRALGRTQIVSIANGIERILPVGRRSNNENSWRDIGLKIQRLS